MAGNPLLNSMTKNVTQGDSRFGRFGAQPQQTSQQAQYGQPQGGQQPSGDTWTCTCGAVNTGNFCPNCGGRRPAPAAWTCTCGAVNTGKFCPNCGKPRP